MGWFKRKPKLTGRELLVHTMRQNVTLYDVEGHWAWSWKGPAGLFTQQVASGVEPTRKAAAREIEERLTSLGVEIFREAFPVPTEGSEE